MEPPKSGIPRNAFELACRQGRVGAANANISTAPHQAKIDAAQDMKGLFSVYSNKVLYNSLSANAEIICLLNDVENLFVIKHPART